jgi:nucleoside-diphosphate-sugar epimerase
MKIVVIGGHGRIGSKIVEALGEHGHDAVAADPSTGVDTLTGKASPRRSPARTRWWTSPTRRRSRTTR